MSLALLCLTLVAASTDVIAQQRDDRFVDYAAEAETLVARADAIGDADLAAEIAATLLPVDADPLARRPRDVRQRTADQTDGRHHIERRFLEVRGEYAAVLYRLARRAVTAGHPAIAFGLLRESCHVDSDYAPTRRLLGDVRVGDEWMTPHEATMQRARKVWHDRFGWIDEQHVPRYEAGERFFRGKWMTAEEEAAIRRNSRYAWEIETGHFIVHSNHSIERAALLAGRLEDYHRFFRRTYTTLFDAPKLTAALLESGNIARRDKHQIRDFASRGEYVTRLTPKMPGVEISDGIYLKNDRTAYFFFQENQKRPTDVLYHEVSHQLLYESDARDRPTAADAHFWVIEGFASYLESFDPGGTLAIDAEQPMIGDPNHLRMYRAREQLLEKGLFEPFASLDSYGQRRFQQGETVEEIRRRYVQATGLTHFFLHAKDGRYRDAFLTHLRDLYDARVRTARSLTELTGLPAGEIDRQYKAYLRTLDADATYPILSERRPD